MKLIYRGEVQVEGGISAALAGCRCDAVELNEKDFRALEKMPDDTRLAWLGHLQCRFVR